MPNGDVVPIDKAKALALLHHAADDLGYAQAMGMLGLSYLFGEGGATKDKAKSRKYLADAVKMGDPKARLTLGIIEAEKGNIDLAIRHWKLAAAAGDERSTKNLWKCFSKGTLGKAELEETLRAYKESCDSMSSEERERCKLFEKTMKAGNDATLVELLKWYYNGFINAKQLNKGLKLHKKNAGMNFEQLMEAIERASSQGECLRPIGSC